MKQFENDAAKFEVYARSDRKPAKFIEDVVTSRWPTMLFMESGSWCSVELAVVCACGNGRC